MACVYEAKHLDLERIVALKILDSFPDADDTLAQRLQREAVALSNLHHKNIMNFYAFGVYEGRPYLVEEYAAGVTLQTLLDKEGALSPARAMAIVAQVCEGIAHAHQNGIVHRDLKPANILLCAGEDGTEIVRVIDFGFAKMMPDFGQDVQKLTKTGWSVGSVHYMSPEQCRGKPVTAQADIYAIGVILHQCLTGTPPFNFETDLLIMSAHIGQPPPTVTSVRANVDMPAPLQDLIFKALAKTPAERYQSVTDLQNDLKSIQAGHTVEIESPFVRDSATPPLSKPPRPKPIVVSRLGRILILICLVLIAGTAWGLKQASSSGVVYKGKTAKELYDIDWAAADKRPIVSAADYNVTLLKTILERNKEDHSISENVQLVDVYVCLAARLFQVGKLKEGWDVIQDPWFREKTLTSVDNPRRNLMLEAGACARLHYADSVPIAKDIRVELQKVIEHCRATDSTYHGLPYVANELGALDNFLGADKRTLDHDSELLAWVDSKKLNVQVGWWNLGRAYQHYPTERYDCMLRAMDASKRAGDTESTLPTLVEWFAGEGTRQMQKSRQASHRPGPVPLSPEEKRMWTACLECLELAKDRVADRDVYRFVAYSRLGEKEKAQSLERVKTQTGLPPAASHCLDAFTHL